MKKNKGFTLIELVAVIVLLAVIIIIIVPEVTDVVSKSKKNAIQNNGKSYIDAANQTLDTMKIDKDLLEDNIYTIKGNELYLGEDKKVVIDYKGEHLNGGEVYIRNNQIFKACLKIDEKEAAYNGEEVILGECKYIFNLFENGYLEKKNNKNFDKFIYDNEYLKYENSSAMLYNDSFIKVDTSKKYKQSITLKSDKTNSLTYAGFASYDIDKLLIASWNFMFVPNTTTKLEKDLKLGDTVVYLENVSNFINSDLSFENGFIIWNYEDSTGYKYPPKTYSRNIVDNIYTKESINRSNNTITLKHGWNRKTVKAGTSLSQSTSGSTYNYGLLVGNLNSNFTTYNNIISGELNFETENFVANKFIPGTRYIRLLLLHNYNEESNKATTFMKDNVFEEIF